MVGIIFILAVSFIVAVSSIVNGIVNYKKEKLSSAIRIKELEVELEKMRDRN